MACAPQILSPARNRPAGCRSLHAGRGDVDEQLPSLLIEVGVVDEGPSVPEIVPQVAHRLDFALRLRAIGATRAAA